MGHFYGTRSKAATLSGAEANGLSSPMKMGEVSRPKAERSCAHCEMLPGNKNNTLRIFIDNKKHPVTDELCQEVGQHLLAASAVDFPSILNFTLEISSPGLDRKLFTIAQCQENIGKKVKLKTKSTIDDQKNFSGTIVSIIDDILQIHTEKKTLNLNWENIDKIRVIYETGQTNE